MSNELDLPPGVEADGTIRIGREKELDEIDARAQSVPGAIRLPVDIRADLPLALLGHPGRAPLRPAGGRAARPATATAGVSPALRHNWVPIGPRNVAGRVRALACADPAAADPQTWFAASAGGGVWRTTNGGRRWQPVWHDQPCLEVGAIAVAPSDPRRIYAATGESVPGGIAVRGFGVFVSADGGDTWDNHGGGAANPVHRGGFDAVAIDPADPLHCWTVGVDGAFRTVDGGVHWERFVTTHVTDAAFSGTRLYLVRGASRAGEGAVLRLDAPKAVAAAVAAELAAPQALSIVVAPRAAHRSWPSNGKLAISPSAPATAYVRWTTDDRRHLGIFRTTNALAANGRDMVWTRLRDHPQFREEGQGEYNLCLAVHPTDPAQVATGMVYLHVSTNAIAAAAAVRWRRVMSWELHDEGLRGHHADQHHVVITGNPAQLWVADDGGVARSLDWATATTIDHGERFRPDPVRPLPAGAVTWQRRDAGISGAQMYDIATSPLVPSVVAAGLQDNGTYLRSGGLSWRPVFGADGGFCAFDPDDPYRLHIAYYGGLAALQFPALLDRHFADGARDDGSVTFRFIEDGVLGDGAPFVPETARHPRRTGRVLHAREGRLYGLSPTRGELFKEEPLGRSFQLRFFPPPLPPPPPPPPPPPGPTDVTIADTPGARGLGLVPGRYLRPERLGIALPSRLPAPYRLAEGDELRITLNGNVYTTTFTVAAGVNPAALSVADVVRLVSAALANPDGEIHHSVWDTPSAVQLVTRGSGPGEQLALEGDALDPLPDGLSRLGLNRGTYRGDDARPASVLLGFPDLADPDRVLSRDFSGAVRTLTVTANAAPARSLRIEPPDFPDPARITAGQLAAALRTALAAEVAAGLIDVHAVHQLPAVILRTDPGRRVVLTGTAADRLSAVPPGAPVVGLGPLTLIARHLGQHRRNWGSVDLRPDPVGGPALELIVSDGVNVTPALPITAVDVADLRCVTAEELHRLIRRHLAANPAVLVRAELVIRPVEGAVSELRFSPANDNEIWAGTPDGGVFVSRDDGVTWSDVGDPRMRLADRPVEAIAVTPDGRTVYVGLTGEAQVAGDPGFLFRSADAGAHWDMVGHLVVAGRAEGVVVDGLPLGVNALELDPGDATVVLAGTDAGVFRSGDGGTTWLPIGEGLPNAPIVDLAVEPVTGVVRAGVWTRGVHERRLDVGDPQDARLVIRATELDDGRRPARPAPSLGTAAPEPVPLSSPDIKVVRRRPAVGPDADLDGVTFDLELPSDEAVPGSVAEVLVQVTNQGGQPLPATPAALPAELPRVVVLWAPVDTGVPALPADLWMRLTAGPLAGVLGSWTVLGDGTLPRQVPAGDTAVRSFAVNWPALAGVGAIGLLALVTAPADPLPAGPLDVAALLGTERRCAYREVQVCREDDDRTLVLRSIDGRDFVIEQPAPPAATGVADRLGFAPADLGVAARVRSGATAPGATRDLAVPAGAPGPGIVLRAAAPIVADLALRPDADEADDPAAVSPPEVAAMISRRARAAGLPIEAHAPQVGVAVVCAGGARVRVTGGDAALRLGLAVGGAPARFLLTLESIAWFNLAGVSRLDLEFVLAGGNVPVRVDLPAENFDDPAHADPNDVVRLIQDALRDNRIDGLARSFATTGLALRAFGHGTLAAAGPAAAILALPAPAARVVASVPGGVNLAAGPIPVLHVEVTPSILVRFDGDPADIADLAHAAPADIRRAIDGACELARVGVRATTPSVDLRVAASPQGGGRRHPVLGGAQLAELAASQPPVAAGARAALFAVRAALGADALKAGVANHLYLRVRNAGSVDSATTRLRLIRLDLATTPIDTAQVAVATPVVVPAGGIHIEEFIWDPGGVAPRPELLLVVAEDDRPDRRIGVPGLDVGPHVPAPFAALEQVHAFAAQHPGVALRLFDVIPGP